jgi:hypothetical protein
MHVVPDILGETPTATKAAPPAPTASVFHLPSNSPLPREIERHAESMVTLATVWSIATAAADSLRKDADGLVAEIERLRAANEDLRVQLNEVEAVLGKLAGSAHRPERGERGERGEPGERGAPGRAGPRGERGMPGKAGADAREIASWRYDFEKLTATVIMSDGQSGAVLDLFTFFERAYVLGRLSDEHFREEALRLETIRERADAEEELLEADAARFRR